MNVKRSLTFNLTSLSISGLMLLLMPLFLINRLPTEVLGRRTTYESVYKNLPDFNYLKVFGSLCFASSMQRNRSKHVPKTRKCVLLDIKLEQNVILCFILKAEKHLSRDVNFYKNTF